jgi:hypothetical protein
MNRKKSYSSILWVEGNTIIGWGKHGHLDIPYIASGSEEERPFGPVTNTMNPASR